MSTTGPSTVVAPAAAVTGRLREASVAAASALTGLAPTVTLGLVAYIALGERAAAVGMPASFIATVIGGSLFTVLARGVMPVAGAASVTTLMLAVLVTGIVADPAFVLARPGDLAALLALTAIAVVFMGVVQMVFAGIGLTEAAKFVPQPVLAGFMNGVAVVFVTAQVPALFGWPGGAWAAMGWHAFAQIQPATLAVGVLTIVAIRGWPTLVQHPRMPRIASLLPPSFAGLLLGCGAYFLVATSWPAQSLGGVLRSVPTAWPSIERLAPWWMDDPTGLLRTHIAATLLTAVLMALIATLDLVLNVLALDQSLAARTEPRSELFALGIANVVSGLFGGLPLQLLRARALITARAGHRRRGALLIGNALLALLAIFGGELLAWLPKVVLAGVMVMSGLLLFDAWSLRVALQWAKGERSPEARLDLALVALVCGISVVWGFAVGVAAGAVLAVVLFIRGMNRSLLRARRTAAEQPSRRIYVRAHETLLAAYRPRIAILELEGALFFGSADRLVRLVDAMEPGWRSMVIDLRRVTLIDASGAMVLAQVHRTLLERGIALRLAGATPTERHGRALAEFAGSTLPSALWHPDVDRAVEAAELQLLAAHAIEVVDRTVPLARSALTLGLDDAQRARVATYVKAHRLAAGERLFAEGDAGDRLYVLTTGSITVYGGSGADPARVRYVTCSPGMMFGEIAMLDAGGRSGEAVADIDSELFVLTADALARLEADDPALCALLYRNIALHLAGRLRVASKGPAPGG